MHLDTGIGSVAIKDDSRYGKSYAQAHLAGAITTEMLWPMLKNLNIEHRPAYTEYLVSLTGMMKMPENSADRAKQKQGFKLLKELLHGERLLVGRVVFDLRKPLAQAFQQDTKGAKYFLRKLEHMSSSAYLEFLTRTVIKDRCPGFVEAINELACRQRTLGYASDKPHQIDKLHAIYGWPELVEHLSEGGMSRMLEHDLGL